jgi:hypothetical protein
MEAWAVSFTPSIYALLATSEQPRVHKSLRLQAPAAAKPSHELSEQTQAQPLSLGAVISNHVLLGTGKRVHIGPSALDHAGDDFRNRFDALRSW